MSSNYAPFSENESTNFQRFNRNFEMMVTERGEECLENNTSTFSDIFEKIREKIFILGDCDFDLSDLDKSKYSDKYNITETNNIINILKKNIVLLYNKKIELEIEIENRTKVYNEFLMNIKTLLLNINSIQHPDSEQLNTLLSNRIEWYYSYLNLDKLILEQFDIVAEYSYLKSTINNFNTITISTICSICMEKQVSWFIDPCGHTICDDCKNKSEQLANCHYCRNKKFKYNKLYL